MSLDSLADAFYDELCDIYHAEKQLLKAIPKMVKKATDEKLVEALTTHLEETKQQVERVEAAFEDTGKSAEGQEVRSDGRADRRSSGDDGGRSGSGSDGCRHHRARTKSRALRNRHVRHALLVGSVAWLRERQGTTGREPG